MYNHYSQAMMDYWKNDPQMQEMKLQAMNSIANFASRCVDYANHLQWRIQTASPKEVLTFSIQAFMLFYAIIIVWHLTSSPETSSASKKTNTSPQKSKKSVSFKSYEKTSMPLYPMTRSRVAAMNSQKQRRNHLLQQPIRNNYK